MRRINGSLLGQSNQADQSSLMDIQFQQDVLIKRFSVVPLNPSEEM